MVVVLGARMEDTGLLGGSFSSATNSDRYDGRMAVFDRLWAAQEEKSGDLPSDIPHGAGVSPHTVTPFAQYGAPVHVGLLLGLTCGVCYARNLLAEAVAEDPAGELARAVPPQWIRDDHARACQVRMSVRLWLAALMSCWVCRFAWRSSPSRAAATIAGDAGGVSAVIVLLPTSASVSLSSVTSSRFAIVGTALGCSTGSGFVRCAYRELAKRHGMFLQSYP